MIKYIYTEYEFIMATCFHWRWPTLALPNNLKSIFLFLKNQAKEMCSSSSVSVGVSVVYAYVYVYLYVYVQVNVCMYVYVCECVLACGCGCVWPIEHVLLSTRGHAKWAIARFLWTLGPLLWTVQ